MWVKYLFFRKLPTDAKELESLADKLGVSLFGSGLKPDTYEIQKRILEALRYRRESWTWLFALIAALSSLVSSVAAWIAVGHSN